MVMERCRLYNSCSGSKEGCDGRRDTGLPADSCYENGKDTQREKIEKLYTIAELVQVLSYMRVKDIINSQCYLSLRSTDIGTLGGFLIGMGMIKYG